MRFVTPCPVKSIYTSQRRYGRNECTVLECTAKRRSQRTKSNRQGEGHGGTSTGFDDISEDGCRRVVAINNGGRRTRMSGLPLTVKRTFITCSNPSCERFGRPSEKAPLKCANCKYAIHGMSSS